MTDKLKDVNENERLMREIETKSRVQRKEGLLPAGSFSQQPYLLIGTYFLVYKFSFNYSRCSFDLINLKILGCVEIIL